jgi:hypothetical protein
MKVFNLTDVPTKSLRQHKLLKQTIVVGGQAVAPGGSVTLKDPVEKHVHAAMQHPLSVKALSLDELPQYYRDAAKAAPAAPAPASPAIAPDFPPPPVSKRSKGG